jgi:hypothetical protein
MKIAVLHGQKHEGSTYHITQLFLDEFKDKNTQINEFYFTEQTSCIGCYNCFLKGENKCPHYEQNKEVIAALDVNQEKKRKIQDNVMRLSAKMRYKIDHTHIPIKIKIMFFIMQLNQKNNEWNPIDRNHWESQGWLDDKRPWKK